MASVVIEKNKNQKRKRLTHEAVKNINKRKQIFNTDAVIKMLFSMGYTSSNISQRLNDIEILVRLLQPLVTEDEETHDCFDCAT